MKLRSGIVISSDISRALAFVRDEIRNERLIEIIRVGEKESFKVEDAKLAVEKAYIADDITKVIVLAAEQFSVVVQNKLLKILEEPPPKTEFILVTASKTSLLPTVRSRLPLRRLDNNLADEELGIDVERLTLHSVYNFIQLHKRTDAKQMRRIIERIGYEAMRSKCFEKDGGMITLFENSIKALDSGTVPTFALSAVLLKLLAKQNRTGASS